MIKKIMKSEIIKKILLSILIIITVSTANPIVSNASIATSIITKPLTSMLMGVLDGVNAILSVLFAFDYKVGDTIDKIEAKITDIKTEFNNSDDKIKVLYKRVVKGLDECEDIYYEFLLSPEDIFSNKVQVTNANIFSSSFDKNGGIKRSNFNLFNHLMKQLKQATAGLYYITRNLAIVILLCLLIYTGIRIVLASNIASEKAKWKMYLTDWLKALALVMFVHIIMIGIFYLSEVITAGLMETFDDKSIVSTVRSNFDKTNAFDFIGDIVYLIMYGYLTYMTIVFLIAYFKRLFYIIVMIIVAPVISSLYALGKEGKTRFNKWFKEFVMGVMVQPFQLLIYSILFLIPINTMTASGGSTFGTIDTQIFALIAMSMIRPIEKFMRNIFGFTGTALDNVASFESGKKTLDKGVEFTKQVAQTAVMVGGAIATGGASLAMSAGAGGGAPAPDSEPLGPGAGAPAPDSEPLGPGAGVDPMAEAENIRSEDQTLEDLIGDSYNEDWTEEDYKAYDELYNEQKQRKANFRNQHGVEPEKFGEGNEPIINGVPDRKNAPLDGSGPIDGNGIPNGNGSNIVLGSANIQIGNATGLEGTKPDANALTNSINEKENNEVDKKDKDKKDEDEKDEDEKDKDKKPKIDGQDLSTALLNKLGVGLSWRFKMFGEPGKNLSARLNLENLSESALFSPEMLQQYEKLRQAGHELTDTYYIGEGGGDWKGTNNINAQFIEQKKEQHANSFMTNPANIEKAISAFGLKDKTDKNTGTVTTAQEQAKEKLKAMTPYSGLGISDVSTIKSLMDRNVKPEQALQTLRKDNKATANYNNYVDNEENIQVMQTMEAEKLGKLAEFRAGDQNVVQQVNQQVYQNISDGREYITSGAAKDPETLNRLVELERKIDSKVTVGSSEHYSKSQYIVGMDKIIEKAVKNNVKSIKLPVNKKVPINDTIKQKNTEAEKGTKALESAMNEVLQERRRQMPPPPKK